MNIMYRVIIKVGYREAFFDFVNPDEACSFATIAVAHQVHNDENEKKSEMLCIQVVDLDLDMEKAGGEDE